MEDGKEKRSESAGEGAYRTGGKRRKWYTGERAQYHRRAGECGSEVPDTSPFGFADLVSESESARRAFKSARTHRDKYVARKG